MLPLFTGAIFLSAALLFIVQPLAGKILLPRLGGSPAVWNTCMVFFQGALLLGYLYAHVLTKYAKARGQVVVHAGLALLTLVALPMPIDVGLPGDTDPVWWLVQTLAVSVGLPFFVVSTTGPLLQRWFSRTDHPASKDPYFLYVASNLGSVVGLLAYPLVIENTLTRKHQSWAWAGGFALLAAALIACGAAMIRRPGAEHARTPGAKAKPDAPVTWARRARWVLWSLLPSSLMLGVTQHMSTDIAAIPLLWIIPLLIYLATLMSAFSTRARVSPRVTGWVVPFVVIGVGMLIIAGPHQPLIAIVAAHIACFTVVALMSHTLLADDRPGPEHLTEFYLLMSLGGVLGGLLNALAAPVLFSAVVEYPLMLGVACLVRPQVGAERSGPRLMRLLLTFAAGLVMCAVAWEAREMVDRPAWNMSGNEENLVKSVIPGLVALVMLVKGGGLRFSMAALVFLLSPQIFPSHLRYLLEERTFFGVVHVYATHNLTQVGMSHGTTLHGKQIRGKDDDYTAPDEETRRKLLFAPNRGEGLSALETQAALDERARLMRLVPTTYFYPTTPIGEVMRSLLDRDKLDKVAIIGLGAGTLAAYAPPGSLFVFHEIDPSVVSLAANTGYFTYIPDAVARGAKIGFQVGDGRLYFDAQNLGPYHLIAIDAFTSDAIPVHLLTKEAFDTFTSKLMDDGILAVHISNRYFGLEPVVAKLADAEHMVAYVRNDDSLPQVELDEGKTGSHWCVLGRDELTLAPIVAGGRWKRLHADPTFPLWTDDFSNPLRVLSAWE